MSTRRLLPFIAILLSLATTAEIATRLYTRLPRLEDELANLYQARVFASGRWHAPSPAVPDAFGIPFVIDLDGRRFSKYPPGESLMLAIGIRFGDPWLIGPLLGVLGLAVVYRIGRELFDGSTARWSLALGLTSPFFLVLTPSAMPHAAGMLATGLFGLAFLRLRFGGARPTRSRLGLAMAAGLALGFAFLTRPYSAVFLAIPFAALALNDLRRDPGSWLICHAAMGVGFAGLAALLPIYNFILTGEWRLSLYELWWSFDRLGFGPETGPHGYTIADALAKAGRDLFALSYDLHGVPFLSLVPLTLGLLAVPRRRPQAELFLAAVLVAALVGSFFYHHSSRLYGPRYLYEAFPAMIILGGRGLVRWSQWAHHRRVWHAAGHIVLGLFFGVNLALFLPFRLTLLSRLYGDALNHQATAAARQTDLHQALVFLFADDWPEAAAGILATDPDLRNEIIYARFLGPESYQAVITAHPDRSAYFWREGRLTPATDPPPEWYPAHPVLRWPKP